jgi:predicted RNase H-like HicB family nuclease
MEAKPVPQVHYDSYTDARNKLKDLLDAAENGQVATVRRDAATVIVLDAERLRHFLASVVPSQAQVVQEAGGWSVFIPGLPIAADGETFEEAITEMADALREYAEDWQDHLLRAPNHRENWGLVQLISLSNDEQLREWLVGSGR